MISIIIPVYNTERYLDRCIGSVMASSYKDFELILVDDGSEDSCFQICEQYSRKDCRIKCISQNHGGVSAARNRGIRESSGEWVVFVDSDDWITADFLEMIASEEYRGQDLLLFDFAWGGKRGKRRETAVFGEQKPFIRYYGSADREFLLRGLLVNERRLAENGNICLTSPCAKAYKKAVIDRYAISFAEDIAIQEDMLFNIEYLLHIQSCAYIVREAYIIEPRPGSATRSFYPRYLENNLRYQEILFAVLEKNAVLSAVADAYHSHVLCNMSDVLARGIFQPHTHRSYSEKCRMCGEMQKFEIYRGALKYNWKLGRLRRKILLCLYKWECYRLADIICRIGYTVVERMERL